MPFQEAKKFVKAEIAPKIEKKDVQMSVAYSVLLENFDNHTKKAAKYMAHANYPGHNKDRLDYLSQIRKSTESYLKKKGKLGEFLKYIVHIDKRSDKLHETFAENIKKREQAKFKEISEKNIKLVKEANFDDAMNDLQALHMHLSPFNRTSKDGNIGEAFLRLDKQIEEKLNNLKDQKRLHSQLFVKGNIFETKDARIYIDGTIDGGKIRYVDIKDKSIKDVKQNEYKEISWLALLRKFPLGKFDLKRGGKNIDIKTDPKLSESKASIQELKLLKQINFFYSGGLEKLAKSPEDKKLLKASLEENLQRLSLYFDRDTNGVVTPTEIFKMLPQSMKVKKLTAMLQGFQQIRMRMQLEGLLKEELGKGDEKDPSKVRFFKAEIDFQNGLYLSAYTKFQKYIKDNKNEQDETVQRNVKIANARLRQSSFYVISLAQRYSLACLNEQTGDKSKFHMREGFRNKVSKKLNKVFSELRRMMQTGEAKDLDEAYSKLKDKPEGGLDVKVAEFGAKGLTETNFLKKHYSFVKTMITTLTKLTGDERQEDGLEYFADNARGDKFRGAARVLFEEQMKRKLIARQKELMKDPKYRQKKREEFMALTAGGKQQLGFEKVVGMMADNLQKKYPGLVKGINLANKGLDAAADFVTDIFSKKETFVDLGKALNLKPEKKTSKYEDYSQIFSSSAGILRRAVQEAGGFKKYHALPLAQKKELYESARMEILLAQHEDSSHVSNVKGYVKELMASEGDMAKRTNSVGYKYNDAFDPNNEFFNLSDEGWDFVESLVGEVPIMAASAGAGNLASLAVKQGAKRLATRMIAKNILTKTLESTAYRLGVRGTAFVADLAVSEVVDRGMRYIIKGQTPPLDITQLLAHSLGTYGSMKYASKGGQKMLSSLAEKGMAGKIASHAISTAAIEAPCMVAVNNLFGQGEGTLLEQYGRALGTMLASKGSMSMLHSSTGRVMIRAEQNYDIKESVHKVKDPKKRDLLNKMVNGNEISVDQLGMIMKGNLSYKQIKAIRGVTNNPKSVKFLLAYEYAKSHGVDNQNITLQYDYLVHQLMQNGLGRDEAHAFLKKLGHKSTVDKIRLMNLDEKTLSELEKQGVMKPGIWVPELESPNAIHKLRKKIPFEEVATLKDGRVIAFDKEGKMKVYKSKADYEKYLFDNRVVGPTIDIERAKLVVEKIGHIEKLTPRKIAFIQAKLKEVIQKTKYNSMAAFDLLMKQYEKGKIKNPNYTLMDAFREFEVSSQKINDREQGNNCIGMSYKLQGILKQQGIKSFMVRFQQGGSIHKEGNKHVGLGHGALIIPYKTGGKKHFMLVDPGLMIKEPIKFDTDGGLNHVDIGNLRYEVIPNPNSKVYPFKLKVTTKYKDKETGVIKRKLKYAIPFDPTHEWKNPDKTIQKDIIRGMGDIKITRQTSNGENLAYYRVDFTKDAIVLKLGSKKFEKISFKDFLNMNSKPKIKAAFEKLAKFLKEDPKDLFERTKLAIKHSKELKSKVWIKPEKETI